MQKVLIIGNYPPPMCGWAIQTVLVRDELRRRGAACAVMNINESRKKRSSEYVDVQNAVDYALKISWFAMRGYRFQVHVNGESKKGYLLALSALLMARIFLRRSVLSFHGGLPQQFFPRRPGERFYRAYRLLFRLSSAITCDSEEIKRAIESYGIEAQRILAVPCFSSELLRFTSVALSEEVESFLSRATPVFFCYLSFRPEYQLPVLREGMRQFRQRYPKAGFIWLGFPVKEMPGVRDFVSSWQEDEKRGLLLLGNLTHDEFLTLLTRCTAKLRTPACDGVSASVLESLALGIPVVASENGRRPAGTVCYAERDPADLCAKLAYVVENYAQVKQNLSSPVDGNNTVRTVDCLLQGGSARASAALEAAAK